MNNQEICICAAVITENGLIIRGHRHSDCFSAILDRGLKHKPGENAQGFITSTGRFVTRKEGRKLQEEAKIISIDPDGYRSDELYSEDLY